MADVRELLSEYIMADCDGIFNDGEVRITSFGTTTLLFDDGTTQLMLDGYVSRPSAVKAAFGRFSSDKKLVAKLVREFDISRLSAIFVSHTHFDHVLDVPEFSIQAGAKVYGSRSTLNVARGNGVGEAFLEEFIPGKTYEVGTFKVTVINSVHSKPTTFNNDLGKEIKRPVKYPVFQRQLPEGGSYDFIVEHDNKRYAFKPSCGYIPGAYDGYKVDVLFLAVARFCQLSDEEKLGYYEETVRTLEPKLVIPVHWDNFFLPIEEANGLFPKRVEMTVMTMRHMIKRTQEDGIDFRILPVLKTFRI